MLKKFILGLIIIVLAGAEIWMGKTKSRWPGPSLGETCKEKPKFEDYVVDPQFSKLISIDLDSNKMAREEMEKELLAATGSAVNFAGKYIVVNHECGLGCQKHAVVDTQGKIVFYGLQSSKNTNYQANSNLIISDNRYYEFKNKEINYLCER